MLNNTILVGRVVDKPKEVKLSSDNCVCTLTLAVERPYRDKQNEKIVDFLPVSVWNQICKFVCTYVNKGDAVGLKCRLKQKKTTIDDTNIYSVEIVCERLVLISTKDPNRKVKSNRNEASNDVLNESLMQNITDPDEDYSEYLNQSSKEYNSNEYEDFDEDDFDDEDFDDEDLD